MEQVETVPPPVMLQPLSSGRSGPGSTIGAAITRDQMMKRLHRVFAPRADGTFIVPSELLEQWKDTRNGGREKVIEEFKSSGFDKDSRLGDVIKTMWWGRVLEHVFSSFRHHLLGPFPSLSNAGLRHCFRILKIENPIHPRALQDLMINRVKKRIREKVAEQSMWVDGEFMSEEDMKTDLDFKEILDLDWMLLGCLHAHAQLLPLS